MCRFPLVNGLGDTFPRHASGVRVPSSPVYISVLAPLVTINGIRATILSSALYPGLAGVYRVDVKVPDGVSGANPTIVVAKSPATSSCGR